MKKIICDNKKKGFTLIELLAVIVVLAIVMGIAAVAITSVLDSTRKSAFISSAKNYIEGARSIVKADMVDAMLGNPTTLNCAKDATTDYEISNDKMKLESGGTSPFGGDFYKHSFVRVTTTEDNCGAFSYAIYLEDLLGNAIANGATTHGPVAENSVNISNFISGRTSKTQLIDLPTDPSS